MDLEFDNVSVKVDITTSFSIFYKKIKFFVTIGMKVA